MELAETVFWYVVAVLAALWIAIKLAELHLKKMEADLHKEVKDILSKIIFMRVETHNDVIYAYNAFNSEFVCQGKDMEDLNKQFGIRFPNSKGIIVRPDDTVEAINE